MRKMILLIMIVSFAFSCLVGCKSLNSDMLEKAEVPDESESDNPFIGIKEEDYYMISFLSGLDYWKSCFEGFEEAAGQLGVRAVYAGDSGYDIKKSNQVLEQVIARKPKGIAIACIDASALNPSIQKAIDAGIQVVTYDSDAPESGRTTFIGTGNRAAGAGAAKHMAQLIGSAGEVAVLYSVGLPCAEERLEGFMDYMKREFPRISIVAFADDKGDQYEATKAIREVLEANASIEGIFCIDGIAGVSAATVVRELDKQGQISIIGFDSDKGLLDLVSSGEVDATIAQGTYSMGYWAMNILFHSAHNMSKERFPVFIDTGFEVVTKDTVKSYYDRLGGNDEDIK